MDGSSTFPMASSPSQFPLLLSTWEYFRNHLSTSETDCGTPGPRNKVHTSKDVTFVHLQCHLTLVLKVPLLFSPLCLSSSESFFLNLLSFLLCWSPAHCKTQLRCCPFWKARQDLHTVPDCPRDGELCLFSRVATTTQKNGWQRAEPLHLYISTA